MAAASAALKWSSELPPSTISGVPPNSLMLLIHASPEMFFGPPAAEEMKFPPFHCSGTR
jgi:hypothetical protein